MTPIEARRELYRRDYQANASVYAHMGISEAQFIRSEMVSAGLEVLAVRDNHGSKPVETCSNRNPLMAMNPTGNECGSPDPVSIT